MLFESTWIVFIIVLQLNYTHKSVYHLIDLNPVKLITTEKPVKFRLTTSFWEGDFD